MEGVNGEESYSLYASYSDTTAMLAATMSYYHATKTTSKFTRLVTPRGLRITLSINLSLNLGIRICISVRLIFRFISDISVSTLVSI